MKIILTSKQNQQVIEARMGLSAECPIKRSRTGGQVSLITTGEREGPRKPSRANNLSSR